MKSNAGIRENPLRIYTLNYLEMFLMVRKGRGE